MGKFSGFSGSSLRHEYEMEDEDPTSGLANLADCMLVLSCGLMTALVMAWNIDIPNATKVEMTENTTEVQNIEQLDDDSQSGGTGYVDVGRVFLDESTGTYYVLENTEDEKE